VRGRVAAAAALAHEAERGGEDAAAALAGLHRARAEGPAVAHPLHRVDHRRLRVARQHEVAVHAVHQELRLPVARRRRRDRQLRRRQALRDRRAAVDAARAGRVPQRARVGEYVLALVSVSVSTGKEWSRGD